MYYIFIKYLQYYIYNNFYIEFDHYTSSKRRSSTLKVFFKTGVLKSFIIFTEKHLTGVSFWRPVTFLKQRFRHKKLFVFLQNF